MEEAKFKSYAREVCGVVLWGRLTCRQDMKMTETTREKLAAFYRHFGRDQYEYVKAHKYRGCEAAKTGA